MTSFARSVLASIFSTTCDFGTLIALHELAHVGVVLATFFGTLVGFLVNFTINRRWAFEATHGHLGWQFARVLPVQAGSTGLQTAGEWLFVFRFGIGYRTAKVLVSVLVYLMWNYPMNRYWVFRTKVAPREAA